MLNTSEIISTMAESLKYDVIGFGSGYGLYLIGFVLVVAVLLAIFSSRLGVFGMIVLIPATVMILSTLGYLPAMFTGFMWFGLFVLIGWIIYGIFRRM